MDDDNDDDVYDDNNDNDDDDDNNDNDDSLPGINDSLALNINAFRKGYNPSRRQMKKRHKKGGGEEERIQRSQCHAGVQSSIPPPRPRAEAGAGADQTTPRLSGGARLRPPPRGRRRGAD